jgi:RNA polymerase sigma factor (TIGR02999 family)
LQTNKPDSGLAEIVRAAANGSVEHRDRLFAELYAELHKLAQRELRRNASATLSATTLLHETFLSMSHRDAGAFADRGHFMAYAARAMRGLLIDYIRSRQSQKRGGQFDFTSMPTELPVVGDSAVDLDKLTAAIDALGEVDLKLAECIDLNYFCGFSIEEIARMWSVSDRTVRRTLEKARMLLFEQLAHGERE